MLREYDIGYSIHVALSFCISLLQDISAFKHTVLLSPDVFIEYFRNIAGVHFGNAGIIFT